MFHRSVIWARNRPSPRDWTAVASSNSVIPMPSRTNRPASASAEPHPDDPELPLELPERMEVRDRDRPAVVGRQLGVLERRVVHAATGGSADERLDRLAPWSLGPLGGPHPEAVRQAERGHGEVPAEPRVPRHRRAPAGALQDEDRPARVVRPLRSVPELVGGPVVQIGDRRPGDTAPEPQPFDPGAAVQVHLAVHDDGAAREDRVRGAEQQAGIADGGLGARRDGGDPRAQDGEVQRARRDLHLPVEHDGRSVRHGEDARRPHGDPVVGPPAQPVVLGFDVVERDELHRQAAFHHRVVEPQRIPWIAPGRRVGPQVRAVARGGPEQRVAEHPQDAGADQRRLPPVAEPFLRLCERSRLLDRFHAERMAGRLRAPHHDHGHGHEDQEADEQPAVRPGGPGSLHRRGPFLARLGLHATSPSPCGAHSLPAALQRPVARGKTARRWKMPRESTRIRGATDMTDVAWTGTPVRPHEGARDNGAEALPWGGRRERLPMRWPFADAVDGFRRKALANPDYDPAATFVWGQMMAVGLIEALKAVEERFGAEGHDVVRGALARTGERILSEMSEGVAAPDDASPAEVTSLIASWINEVVYASIERPR